MLVHFSSDQLFVVLVLCSVLLAHRFCPGCGPSKPVPQTLAVPHHCSTLPIDNEGRALTATSTVIRHIHSREL